MALASKSAFILESLWSSFRRDLDPIEGVKSSGRAGNHEGLEAVRVADEGLSVGKELLPVMIVETGELEMGEIAKLFTVSAEPNGSFTSRG